MQVIPQGLTYFLATVNPVGTKIFRKQWTQGETAFSYYAAHIWSELLVDQIVFFLIDFIIFFAYGNHSKWLLCLEKTKADLACLKIQTFLLLFVGV